MPRFRVLGSKNTMLRESILFLTLRQLSKQGQKKTRIETPYSNRTAVPTAPWAVEYFFHDNPILSYFRASQTLSQKQPIGKTAEFSSALIKEHCQHPKTTSLRQTINKQCLFDSLLLQQCNTLWTNFNNTGQPEAAAANNNRHETKRHRPYLTHAKPLLQTTNWEPFSSGTILYGRHFHESHQLEQLSPTDYCVQ